jgi:hypothetical protein
MSAPESGIVRQDQLGGTEIEVRRETSATAVAEMAKAEVTAAIYHAKQFPRDWSLVRQRVLKECERPGFAEVARYKKPIGAGIFGPSIRFVEAVARIMGNLRITTTAVYDDSDKRICRITVLDCETMTTFTKDVIVPKEVERRQLRKGEPPLRKRFNHKGEELYIYPATDDEILSVTNSLISKAIRTECLRLIPGDIVEEAMDAVIKTQGDAAAEDPEKEAKRIADGFLRLNIPVNELSDYLGNDVGRASPLQLVELRALYTCIRDGDGTWAEVMEMKIAERSAKAGEGEGDAGDKVPDSASGLRDKITERTKAQTAPAESRTGAEADAAEAEEAKGAEAPAGPAKEEPPKRGRSREKPDSK